jgi:diguanylate cyclase (GGDEF)-like protein/PAS domain S-box-containing protein
MKKISYEIAIKLALFTLALAMVVGVYLYQSYHQSVTQLTLENLLVESEGFAMQLNDEMDYGAMIVNSVSRYLLDRLDSDATIISNKDLSIMVEAIDLQVKDLMQGQRSIAYFSLYFYPDDKENSKAISYRLENDGALYLRDWSSTEGILKATEDPIWRSVLEKGTNNTWSPSYSDGLKGDGESLLAYSKIVKQKDNTFCVIVIELSPVKLVKYLPVNKVLNFGHYVLSNGQQLIYDSQWFSKAKADEILGFVPIAIQSGKRLIYQMDQQGQYVATMTPVHLNGVSTQSTKTLLTGDSSWWIIGLYDKAVLEAYSSKYVFPWALITSFVILFLLTSLFWLTYSITKPLQALTQSVIAYSGTDKSFMIPNSIKRKRNEFSLLANAIHGLITRIIQFNEKIEFQNQELVNQLKSKEKMIQEISVASQIIDTANEGICIANRDFQVTYVNAMFSEITGYDKAEIIGRSVSVLDPNQRELSQEIHEELKMFSVWSGFVKQLKKDGTLYDQKLTLRTMCDKNGEVGSYIATFDELEDMPLLSLENRHYDPLTGLITKETLVIELKNRASNREHAFAFLLLGIDRFRAINQTLGHEFGDDILRRMTSRILNAIPTTGTLLSRFGGDEFAIVLEHYSDKHQLMDLAENLIALTNEPFVIEGERVFITASVGICLFPEDATTVEELLKRTTSALHVAKESGRKTFKFFSRQELDLVNRHIKLMGLMNEGWKNKEFYIVYQPKVDLKSEMVVGAEALMRWKSPTVGEVSPMEFIPIAEELGLINEMGAWCIQEAASKVEEINGLGISAFRMSVNLSYYQLMDEVIIEIVKDAISTCHISPEALELEITESILMTNVKRASGILSKLKSVGVFISVDDFGTGYSSLSYLKNLPIDILKIDRSFIKDIPADEGTLAKIIIQLAESLSMQVIAEGVETIEQIEFLRTNGCFEVQGYFYSKPLEFVDFYTYCKEQFKAQMS